MFQEIVNFYVNRGSKVFVCMLDCSKAFDRVSYEKLFKVLSNRGMCPMQLRMLWSLYEGSKSCVKWEEFKSDILTMSNRVKQGGVSSPNCFSVYIDKLFDGLRNAGRGCYLNGKYTGILGYADDIALLATSKTELEAMLKICDYFANSHDLLLMPQNQPF